MLTPSAMTGIFQPSEEAQAALIRQTYASTCLWLPLASSKSMAPELRREIRSRLLQSANILCLPLSVVPPCMSEQSRPTLATSEAPAPWPLW